MDDYISRQAAIDALWAIKNERESVYYTSAIYNAVDAIEALPSAERRGRWAKIELSAPSGDYVMFQCSECASLYNEPSSYCPNCGARMDDNATQHTECVENALDALDEVEE